MGALGLLLNSVVLGVTSVLMERLCRKRGPGCWCPWEVDHGISYLVEETPAFGVAAVAALASGLIAVLFIPRPGGQKPSLEAQYEEILMAEVALTARKKKREKVLSGVFWLMTVQRWFCFLIYNAMLSYTQTD
ncbi:hypothetical protein JHK87_014699 [Glycine soja]|nr:hypothetical protein JHK87_014699 [Glycine soja]